MRSNCANCHPQNAPSQGRRNVCHATLMLADAIPIAPSPPIGAAALKRRERSRLAHAVRLLLHMHSRLCMCRFWLSFGQARRARRVLVFFLGEPWASLTRDHCIPRHQHTCHSDTASSAEPILAVHPQSASVPAGRRGARTVTSSVRELHIDWLPTTRNGALSCAAARGGSRVDWLLHLQPMPCLIPATKCLPPPNRAYSCSGPPCREVAVTLHASGMSCNGRC